MMVDVTPAARNSSTRVIVIGIVAGLTLFIAFGLAVVRLGGAANSLPDTLVGPRQAPLGVVPGIAPGVAVQRPSTTRVATSTVDPAWAARTGTHVGIPVPAMVAYGNAELAIARQQPDCHLSWNTLAGIGWIESQHGTLDGRTLLANGYSSTTIVGPALDGTSYAAIHSTAESRAWHGDPAWEHAVGPMQFIASTWDRWGSDGNGDGNADPRDFADAALTAAKYLCADGYDLATAAGWQAAIRSFNHDQAYVSNVLAAANTYAQRSVQR
jgi:membrane-bound lytic murein transglycosylase B